VNPFTIYVCENQPVLVEGLQHIIDGCDDLKIIGQSSDLGVAIAELAGISADVFFIGQPFTAKSILPLLGQAREADVSASIVLWVGELSEMDSFRALQMGAKGIMRKTQPVSVVLECLRTVASGSVYLENSLRSPTGGLPRRNGVLRITRREREIVEFVCRGLKNKEIAEALSITPGTVKVHLMHIFEKTGVKDRFQLALQGRQFLSAAESDPILRRTAEV
jgi:two-component system, NarL family, nitrate/nitrite response regulator NarL